MKFVCPKCKANFDNEPKIINGQFSIVCPYCGKWDRSKDERSLVSKWVPKQCYRCEQYTFGDEDGYVRKFRRCSIMGEEIMSEPDLLKLAKGECRFFKKKEDSA